MESQVKHFRNILADSVATEIKEHPGLSIITNVKIVEYELVEDLIQAITGANNDTDYSIFHDKVCNFVDDIVKEFSK